MGDIPRSQGSSQLEPTPQPNPYSIQTNMTKNPEDISTMFTQLTTEIADLRTDIADLNSNYNRLETDHKQLRIEHTQLLRERREFEQKLCTLNVYLKTFQADHSKVREDQDRLKSEIDIMRTEHQTEIGNIRAEQQAQLSRLKEVFALKDDVVKEMTSLREEMTSQSRDLVSAECTRSEGQLQKELNILQSDISQLRADNQNVQAELTQLQEDHQNMKKKINKLRTDQAKLLRDTDKITSDQKTVQEDIAKLQRDIESITTDQNTFQADMAKLQQNHIETVQAEMIKQQDCIDTFQASMAKLQMDHIETVQAEHLQLQQNQDTLTSDVDTVKTDVEQMKTSLHESLTTASLELTALKTTLKKAKRMFCARWLDTTTTQQYHAMIFRTVGINEGDHYNPDTGMFTAPCAGLYFFTASVESNSKDTPVYGRIMVDDDLQCVVRGEYDAGSGHVMVLLVPGQNVWVRAISPVDKYYSTERILFRGTLVLPFP